MILLLDFHIMAYEANKKYNNNSGNNRWTDARCLKQFI